MNDSLTGSAALADEMRSLGQTLWVGGAIVGSDRVSGASPFEFGDDAVVAWAMACQIAGELGQSATLLLEQGHLYGAATLLRQIVEVEYLVAWLGSGPDVAAEWMRSSRRFPSPSSNAQHTTGAPPYEEYAHHCDNGGHPNPNARFLLPHHSDALDVEDLADDLNCHLDRLIPSLRSAAERLGYGE